ncbi:MAG: galactose mutarotase [Bacteroidales bacterium]|jgi:aldose 1-epimerase|nr:galactose mutarotase [Bacteroidales bacterium]
MKIHCDKKGVSSEGKDILLFTMDAGKGIVIRFCNIGAAIVSVCVPDSHGVVEDVVLGYDNLSYYVGDGPCFGKVPGRYANRIAYGKFSLGGRTYTLPVNNGPNHLHGGPDGYANRLWQGKIEDDGVSFYLTSEDGDSGYPGKVNVKAHYRWVETNGGGRLELVLKADTDAPTVINLTNHTYFNLNGAGHGDIRSHMLRLHASKYLPTDSTLIPTGEIAPVSGTPMDFTSFKSLGERLEEKFPALEYGKGYDNCWVLDGWHGKPEEITGGDIPAVPAAELYSSESGRKVNVYTNSPGIQVYTGNWLTGSQTGKGGCDYKDYDGVAMECQGFPDAPNKPAFPTSVLRPGDNYENKIIFEFTTI